MTSVWRSLPCKISELRLDITLECGQSFRWREIRPGVWRSVLANKVWTLQQNDGEILYQVIEQKPDDPPKEKDKYEEQKHLKVGTQRKNKRTNAKEKDTELESVAKEEKNENDVDSAILKDFFQLHVNLKKLYKTWTTVDANFKKVAESLPGVRVLRQDPTENLFSFICSSNNNISRITKMVEKLCSSYGEKVADVDGTAWFAFPLAKALARDGVEDELRGAGFGYRAKFINQTAKAIESWPAGWLEDLRQMTYEEAHAELVKLPGVGSKVADCVCLMSLNKTNAIPIDTHVWQIASRDYKLPQTQTKTMTDRVYREIGHFFRNLFGEYAGWAHSVLFSADLKKFQTKTDPSKSPKKRPSQGKTDLGDSKRSKKEIKKGKKTKT